MNKESVIPDTSDWIYSFQEHVLVISPAFKANPPHSPFRKGEAFSPKES